MRLLVTGSEGLVGTALQKLKIDDVVFASRKDANLADFEETIRLFERVEPEAVIHLAAKVGGIGGNLKESADYFRENIQINLNTLEAARLNGVKRLVSFMSTCVFPVSGPFPLNARDLHNGPPHPSNFGYAYAKRMLEVQSRAVRHQWNLNYCIAVPCNIYGENDNFDLTEGHVIPAIIHKIYLAEIMKEPLNVWGDGSPLREFAYSADIAQLALWMIENYLEDEPLVMSPQKEYSIRELVEIIAKEMHFGQEIVFDVSKPAGQLRKPSDSSELNRLNPAFEFTPLDEGISRTVSWFLDNYPNIRGSASFYE